MVLLDTNIFIEVFRKNRGIIEIVSRLPSSEIALSSITQMELYYGALNKKELKKIKSHLMALNVIPLTSTSCLRAVELVESYSKSHGLTIPDALIAATALELNLPLFTLNKKDFIFIKNLILYQY